MGSRCFKESRRAWGWWGARDPWARTANGAGGFRGLDWRTGPSRAGRVVLGLGGVFRRARGPVGEPGGKARAGSLPPRAFQTFRAGVAGGGEGAAPTWARQPRTEGAHPALLGSDPHATALRANSPARACAASAAGGRAVGARRGGTARAHREGFGRWRPRGPGLGAAASRTEWTFSARPLWAESGMRRGVPKAPGVCLWGLMPT